MFDDELCKVVVEGATRYLLTNNVDYNGSKPAKMDKAYKYSWWLCSSRDCDSLKIYRDFKPSKRRPL